MCNTSTNFGEAASSTCVVVFLIVSIKVLISSFVFSPIEVLSESCKSVNFSRLLSRPSMSLLPFLL